MSQVNEILELLKAEIRRKGLTYKALSADIDVSESTLKRWFSQGSFNIERLDDICQTLQVDLAELMRSTDRQHRVLYLNEDQELQLAADRKLFMAFYLAIEGKTRDQICRKLSLSEVETRGLLIRLDQLGLIELHAQDRIIPLVTRSIRWLTDGPLNQEYGQFIRRDFMDSAFDGLHENLWLESGFVSQSSLDVFSRKLDQLMADFREMMRLDEKSNTPKRINLTFIAAHRPWILPVFGDEGQD